MKNLLIRTACLVFMTLTAGLLHSQVPQLISYQGRVGVDGVNFDGSGQFKFAFVNAAGTTTYWSNDGSSTAGSEPGNAISIPVSKGLYAVLLGDATLPHMSIVPATVFTHGDVHLRVWFSDGVNGFQQLTPDRRIAAVGYAMMADSVSDGAITTAKITDGAVTSEKLAAGVVQTANLATGAVGNAQLANSVVTINAGTGLGGGGLVSLGGAVSLSNAGVLSLTGGGGITVDAATGAITLGSSATSAGTAGAIVARDANGGFTAGTITGTLNGNAATATTATDFTGMLAGDVTGTQAATTIAATTVTGKALTGFTSAAGSVTASDTLLSAISKLDGNTALKAPLASPTFTGSVTLPAGSATTAPLLLQTGTSLTTPTFGAFEFDGTNLFVTNNSTSPTRKTVAFTDTPLVNAQIADGAVTAAKLATGAVGSAQLALGAAAANLSASGQSGVPSGGLVLASTPNPSLVEAGYTEIGASLATVSWQQRAINAAPPPARWNHSEVWTGTEMIVWGGNDNDGIRLNNGGRYNVMTNAWSEVSTIGAPTQRYFHSSVWTGSVMVVWGGVDNGPNFNDGGRYSPMSNTWTSVSTVAAPTARNRHTAVWTGTEMVIWGGLSTESTNDVLNSGGRYNPTTNTWSAISNAGAPAARYLHTAIWTGSEMIIWGGRGSGSFLNSGARYNPTTNTWTAIETSGAPSARGWHTAVWTGSEMIVWGGDGSSNLNGGGRYNPATNTWSSTSTVGAPSARSYHTAIWTGIEMIVWGGQGGQGTWYLNDGGRYNPSTNVWLQVTTTDAPAPRDEHTALWTGSKMLIWGGKTIGGSYNDTFSYTPGQALYIYQRP